MELGILLNKNKCPICHKNIGRMKVLRKKDGVVEGMRNLFLFKLDLALQIQN